MARKLPDDWRDRVIAVLRAAFEMKRNPRYGAAKIRERDERIVELALAEIERVELELIRSEPMVSDPYRYARACGVAADRLEAAR